MSMWTKAFWVSTFERAATTFAFSAGAMFGTSALHELEFGVIASTAGAAALLSILKAIGSLQVNGTASVTGSELPMDVVVEKQVKNRVVAGPANEVVKPGITVRYVDENPDGTPIQNGS